MQGFQYFSSVPVFHYLQAVLFIKILKSGGTRNPFRQVKVPGTRPLLKGLECPCFYGKIKREITQ